ncbi:klarsicht protein isoform X3 [Drosophila nasuta]|uniref:klarsicht protein isoform X3 n=1 Tax=Drosophila nasuta TaxID=42062 RepID=UPI00295E6BC3|nr:klarsicht protein isoform X3 [Drosophila nasuta]
MEAVRHENEKGTEAKAEIEIEIKTEEGEGRENAEREAMTETETSNCCNQETETAAMMKCGGGGNAIETTTPTTTKTTMRLEDVAFVMPATPTTTVIRTTKASKSANSSRSSSLRKQRRNNSDAAAAAGVASGVGGGGQANNDMKTSQSMTSLPADELQQERRDVIQAKLHLERPYNSLKKNSQSNKCSSGGSSNNNKMHRYSWGSGHSHSSSTSLHSSATLGLGSSGKDDLWAAIQTNYNYIMDTNLLDTCKEARFEIEEAQPTSRECKFTGSQLHILDETQRQEGLCEDPKELRRWLRDMENKLESSPTISELTLYSNSELQRHLAVHSVLYHEIVSHARVVSACIRAASERERAAEQQSQQTATATATQQPASLTSNCSSESTTSESVTKSNSLSSGFASDGAPLTTPSTAATTAAPTATAAPSTAHPRKGEGNLERLRDRYHLLYLKAFELQLCLDNLLRKRSSTATGLDDDDDTEDDSFGYEGEEGDAATEDDLNEVVSDLDLECESAASHNSAELLLQRCQVAATEIVSANVPAATEDQSRDCIATQKILKSADASSDDDDEGWLYTAATTAGATAAVTATSTVDGLQSAAISSTTSGATAAATVGTTAAGATATTTSDDSDKENKETLVSTSTTATTASIATSAVSVGVVLVGSGSGSNSNYDSSSACSSSNSNGVHTETSATSRVTQMQRSGVVVSVMDMEMQLQSGSQSSDGSHSNNNNHNTRHIISNNCYKQLQSDNNNSSSNSQQSQQLLNANNNNNNNYNNHKHQQQSRIDSKQQQQQQQQQIADEATAADNANGNAAQLHLNSNNNNNGCSFYSRADICNISVWPSEMTNGNGNVQQQNVANGNRLPPRSPAKSVKSQASSSNATMSPSKGKVSHDSIKQLVLEAEHLVRDAQEAALKTPTKQKHSIIKISSTVKKRDIIMPGPIKQRVEEWLEHQPSTPQLLNRNHHSHEAPSSKPDDCEASGEASETDSMPHKDATCGVGSDSSEGFTDSIATCMQTSTNSYGNSTERIGGSAEPIHQPTTPLGFGSSNQSLNVKVVKRPQSRRKSERPWSVSCLSQLTTDAAQLTTIIADVGQSSPPGLASHSISESALDSLSPGPRARAASSSGTGSNAARKADSKGSLRRRRARKKRMSAASGGRKSDSGSETHGDLTQTLMKSCESMSSQQLQEFTNALLSIQKGGSPTNAKAEEFLPEGESESHLMVPKFRVGSFTTAALMASEIRLGALAALSNYMNEDEQQAARTPVPRPKELSTEDHHSSISETAWDDYQEKYNSENYSEGFDSDAARRLLEFGDDYRNFIDSQSDCCSSLSAANNLDSFSPPRMDSLQQHELKALHINQETISSSVDHARRQRALELQSERRRKTLEVRRKSCQDMAEAINSQTEQQQQQQVTTANLSSSATALMTPKNPPATRPPVRTESVGRKLEFGAGMSHSAQSLLRRTSESDTSTRRRRTVTADERRRSSRNLEKCIKLIPATSSSSGDDSEDGEQEMRSLLQQSRDRLEDTRALKIRCHLLRPEDYHEIINTCRDNIRCLEAVLRGPPGTVLSTHCAGQTKDLLAAWEDLLNWSENAAGARKLQQEMSALKHTLRRLGDNATPELLDTEPAIQIAVEALKQEQTQLGSYRTNMLRLNASVHSWLTRQERRLQQEQQQQQQQESEQLQQLEKQQQLELKQQQLEQQQLENGNANSTVAITVTDSNGNQVVEASTGTSSNWDVNSLLSAEQEFHKHLKDEVSDMYSAWDEADARINSQLEMLTNSLIAWRQLECGLSEFQLALGQDRGTLKGLEGALDKGQATPVELAQNVKLVAKLLSEKVNVSQEQLLAVQQHLDPNHIYHIAKFTASNGSLSDSGISDGGATSDGGLSERERRLGVLRRLAKQLELALAPGSAAMRSIAARMESAEAELKQLQNTCRDLIVRTAASHQQKQQQQEQQQKQQQQQQQVEHQLANGHVKQQALKPQQAPQQSSPKRRNARKARQAAEKLELQQKQLQQEQEQQVVEQLQRIVAAGGGDDPEDPANEAALLDNSEDEDDTNSKAKRRGWAWRIARAAVPMQLALFTFFCAACMMQPNCCDNLNNLSMSFTPQLRYIRGPPPI